MATDIERLTVVLEANIKKYEKEMAKTHQVMDRAMKNVERSASTSMKRLEGIMGGGAARLKAGLAAAFAGLGVREVAQLADSYTRVQNALKVAGLEGDKLKTTYDAIYAISQRQGAPLEAMATLYGRVAQTQRELGATSSEMMRFTEGVGMALRVQGTDATKASGALMQLSQALGSSRVMTEEFNSINEGARPILKAVAAGLVEAGGSVSKLKQLVIDGKISNEAFFKAFLAGMPLIEAAARTANLTMAQGYGKARDALVNLIGKLDEASGMSVRAGQSFDGVAVAIGGIADRVPAAMQALNSLQAKMTEIGNSSVWDKIYNGFNATGLTGMNGVKDLNNFDKVFGTPSSAGSMKGFLAAPGSKYAPDVYGPAVPTPRSVSTADYPVLGGGGGSKAKSSREKIDEYEREIETIGKRTRALEAERETVGKSAGDTAKAEAAFRLLEAAKKANVAVTPQILADIDAMATKYGEATDAIEKARDAQEAVADAMSEVGSMLSGAFTDAILEGEKLDDVMQKLLKSLASKGIDSIFNSLFSSTPGGGALGGLIGSLFSPGKASGGPVKAGQPYTVGESGRETFVPTSPGRIIPHGRGGGGAPQIIIQNHGAKVSTRQTNGPRGPTTMIQIENAVAGAVANGGLDKVLKQRFGVSPMGGK
ncbi:MAG: hypothetical protein K0S56_532 [Microvirga sp.]|jgi:tape measure domain-containing protein|nr:hypothetical protein [Microvirga sp.]